MTRCTEAVPQCMGRVNFGQCHCPAQETRRTNARQQDMPTIWVRFSDCGQHIRKWSRAPFEDGEQFATVDDDVEAALLKAWEAWEGAVILDPAAWAVEDGFTVTGAHYDRYMELQAERARLLPTRSPSPA